MGRSSRRIQRSARRVGGSLLVVASAAAGLTLPTASAASAPGAPELVSPAPGHVFDVNEPQLFTLRTTAVQGDRWVGQVEVSDVHTGVVIVHATTLGRADATATATAPPGGRPGNYTWRARALDASGAASAWSEARPFAVGANQAPHQPQLLSPPEGATLRRAANLPFSVNTIDVDNDVVTASISIRDATGAEVAVVPTSPAPSGATSAGVLVRVLSEGAYTWSAHAVDVHGAVSASSSARSFSVSSPPSAGGGLVIGEIAYANGGLPASIGVCEPSSATFSLDAAAAVVNAVFVGYVGALRFRGSGGAACENALFGAGTLTLDVTGTGPTESTISCLGLNGTYTRTQAVLVLELSGGCRINNRPVSPMAWRVSLAFVPRQPTGGVTTRVHDATVAGVLTTAAQ